MKHSDVFATLPALAVGIVFSINALIYFAKEGIPLSYPSLMALMPGRKRRLFQTFVARLCIVPRLFSAALLPLPFPPGAYQRRPLGAATVLFVFSPAPQTLGTFTRIKFVVLVDAPALSEQRLRLACLLVQRPAPSVIETKGQELFIACSVQVVKRYWSLPRARFKSANQSY